MNKKLIPIVLIFLSVFYVFAGDIGITLDSLYAGSYSGSWADPYFSQEVALWGNTMFSDSWGISAEASYKYTTSRDVFVELNELLIMGNLDFGSSYLKINAGRTSFSEFSGKVFAHKGDGLYTEWGSGIFGISAFATYTGLLQLPSSSIVMSNSDYYDVTNNDNPIWGPFASPRLVEGLAVKLNEFAARQSLVISGLFQQDLRADSNLHEGTRVNTQYAGIGISGPLNPKATLSYSLYGYGNMGQYGNNTIIAFMGGGNITLLMPEILGSSISLEGVYSSGDKDSVAVYEGNTTGYDTAFLPVSKTYPGFVYTPALINIFYVGSYITIKPFSGSEIKTLDNIMLMLRPVGIFRSTTGAISSGTLKSSNNGLYLGTEVDMSIIARLLSDLGLSISGGMFMPSGVFEDNSIQTLITASLSITL
ncbi:hypothetical protein WKV44_09325 [Spirochaetia bacterium 38H-sp]|uniref:DUF5723 domain-containing protein n=1 Tax=Rarispira pelagica TaxID=3141764 RepID=A0ABU9UDJ2_9SPIR